MWEARSAAQDHVPGARRRPCTRCTERVQVYPADVRDRIRADVDAYVAYVVHTEWPHMADHGEVTAGGGTELLDGCAATSPTTEPKTDFEAQAYQPLVDQVAAADEARTARARERRGRPCRAWCGSG